MPIFGQIPFYNGPNLKMTGQAMVLHLEGYNFCGALTAVDIFSNDTRAPDDFDFKFAELVWTFIWVVTPLLRHANANRGQIFDAKEQ